ncbi:hypothetical protein [Chitinimonas sp. BJB300]|uniref:hypothetical protein n=1 Tax=Chitinimonas sp. BJB300 TaxID=1559339 RepID=UPI000C0C797A|nr:hypothetical protein [Chitinimonas sp. BJB300]PHV13527.1 hypothetical protein CSQ89_00390 [Chitinimonas sp. BJB300]TSJ89790.1 hypothetical protein FG002_006150 [Chitinimonas sp. BJB300]
MFPLSAERVVLAIMADSLQLVRLSGHSVLASRRLNIRLSEGALQLEEVGSWLQVDGAGARKLEVVISNTWVRYAVLHWQASLADDTLCQDYARTLMTEQYGEASNGWSLTISPLIPNRNRIVSAIDARLLAALTELASAHRLKLSSVRPLLASVYNQLESKLPNEALLAVVEPQRLCLLQVGGGDWINLYNRMLSEPWERRLPGLVAQASASLNALDTPVFIVAPSRERPDLGRLSATWLRLPARAGFHPRDDKEWAFCLGC